jgi:hypothetical protein
MLRSRFPVVLLPLACLWAQGAGAAVQSAGAAPGAPSVNARALGMSEAMLDYCAKNDPPGAAKVRARLRRLAQGAGKEALAEARNSTEYHRAHDTEVDFISKIDSHNAHRLCSGSVAGNK